MSRSFQNRTGAFGEVGEEDDRFEFGVGSRCQDGSVAGGMEAKNGLGSCSRLDAQELRANGNMAVGANPDLTALAPDKRPPGAVGFGA